MDVGRHALMRGLATACPIFVRGWSLSYDGHQHEAGLQASLGSSPPWARPQLCTTDVAAFLCRNYRCVRGAFAACSGSGSM